jgi:uncharacterized protein YjiS (DUF1127 family)
MTCIAESQRASSQPFSLPFGGAYEWIVRGLGGIARAMAGRRALKDLAGFDDRMLKDIGLNRSDLRNAAAEPLYRDPTAILAGRVDETRGRVARGKSERITLRGNVISY